MEAAAEVDPDKHAILPEFLPDSFSPSSPSIPRSLLPP